MRHNYTIIFSSPGACRVPVLIADRAPNPARLRSIGRKVRLAKLTREERKLVTQIASGDEPWTQYARGSWDDFLTEPTSNPKIKKGLNSGIATTVLHLAPSVQSGKDVCVFATPGCAGG